MELEELVVRSCISTNAAFHSTENYDYRQVLSFLNPSAQLPRGQTFFDTVLDRVHAKSNKRLIEVYAKGSYVTVSADGWKAGNQKKWLGLCRVVRALHSDDALVQLSDMKDVTTVGETEDTVASEIGGEIERVREGLSHHGGNSCLVAVVTDSAASNVGAKLRLADKYDDISFLACFAHQLNLMAGNILTHPSTKRTVKDAKGVVSFFNTHPKHKSMLQMHMERRYGTSFEFVVEGDTRWYSHYGMVQSLVRGREALNLFKQTIEVEDSFTTNEKCDNVLNIICNVTFWRNLRLISKLLRPITIDIGIIERRTSTLSEVTQVFGRYWAYLRMLLLKENVQYESLPGLLEDLLQRWEWRFNLYYDVDLLITAYVLDPRVGIKGLFRGEGHLKDIFECLQRVMERRFKKLGERKSDASGVYRQLKKEFILWCQASALEGSGEGDPIQTWLDSLEFGKESPLRVIALELLSIVPHAADLERVWSAAALVLSSRRQRLTRATVLKILQIKTELCHEERKRRAEKQGFKDKIYEERNKLKQVVRGVGGIYRSCCTNPCRDGGFLDRYWTCHCRRIE